MSKQKKTIAFVLTILTLLILTASVPPAKAQFVISSWDFPDAYGQGIDRFQVYGNSTGSWVTVGSNYFNYQTIVYNWVVGVAIKLRCYTWLNSTLTGAADGDEGKNYQRHNVTVTDISDNVVFSQQNFTFFYVDDEDELFRYDYDVVLNFLPDYGQYYTVTVIYEIFW